MLKKLAFVIFALFVCNVHTDMQTEATKACKEKPKFYDGTTKVLNAFGDHLNMQVGNIEKHNKAHVIPTDAMRTMICKEFSSFKASGKISNWKIAIGQLITKLHSIDTEWKDLSTLKKDKSWLAFEKQNNKNKEDCNTKLGKFTAGDKRSEVLIAADLGALFRCTNSAPANLRIGYSDTNRIIGNMLDPVLKHPVDEKHIVTVSNLTTKSRSYQTDYGSKYGLQYKTYSDGGIMTSDQPLRKP